MKFHKSGIWRTILLGVSDMKKTSSPLFLQQVLLLRLTILNNNRACLDRVADELCENESISGAAFGSVSTFFFVEMFEIISQRIGDVWCICMYLPTFA